MVQRAEFASALLCRIRHGAEHEPMQPGHSRSGISNVLALLQLHLVAVLDEFLVRSLLGAAGRVLDDGPEVGDAEDDV